MSATEAQDYLECFTLLEIDKAKLPSGRVVTKEDLIRIIESEE